MRYSYLLFVTLLGAAPAGPVGQYLGFEAGKTETGASFGQDSLHYFFPVPGDTVLYRNILDTTTVLADLDSAWALRRSIAGDTSFVSHDTVLERGDTMLVQPWQAGDSLRWYQQYLVPFLPGQWWRTGLEGTYHTDLDGDGTTDTLVIWADTVSVEGLEDVAVPYGTLLDCYRLRTTMRRAVGLTVDGIPVRETSAVSQIEWYKDSLFWVKDSSRAYATIHANLGFWVMVADAVSQGIAQLTGLSTGAAEARSRSPAPGLRVSPNPFSHEIAVSAGHQATFIEVCDAAGRVVHAARLRGSGRLDLGFLPCGTYFIRDCRRAAAVPAAVTKTR